MRGGPGRITFIGSVKYYRLETFGTVEVRLWRIYRGPGEEVGVSRKVGALIEVAEKLYRLSFILDPDKIKGYGDSEIPGEESLDLVEGACAA